MIQHHLYKKYVILLVKHNNITYFNIKNVKNNDLDKNKQKTGIKITFFCLLIKYILRLQKENRKK